MSRRAPFEPFLLLLAFGCGGGAAQTQERTSVQLPLDVGGASSSAPSPAVAEQQPATAQPAAASKDDGGALLLDAWHRKSAETRRAPGGGGAAELSELQQALGGQAAAMRARWTQRPPAALGAEARRLAAAFAGGDAAGLEAALAAAPAREPARLAFLELLAVRALELQQAESAGRALGALIVESAAAGYPRERILEWSLLAQGVADGIGKVLPATDYVVADGDSYWKICRNLRKIVDHGWIKLFNRRRGDNIRAGETLRIPSVPLRIECWRQLRFAAVFAGVHPVRLYATSSGKPESPTPLGEFTLQTCEPKPIYYPPGAPSIPYGNPQNPLGERWLGFAEDKQYGLHGTNSESTIGSFETGGCIRMHNADVVELFDLAGPGAKVRINP
jgi:hypothetical protein